MAEEEVWENERDLERLGLHEREGDEGGLDYEGDVDNEENYYFGQVEENDCEYEDSDEGTYYSEDEEPRAVFYNSLDYNILPPEIWSKILSALSRWDMCQIAMISPFFYKIVGADFKRLCREFNVFKLVGETNVCAFNSFFLRKRSKPGVPCNYKLGLYCPDRQVITVMSLDLDDTNMTVIPVREKLAQEWMTYMYNGATRLRSHTETGVYYHDAQTGALLAYIDLTDRSSPWEDHHHYTYYYVGDMAILFSGISLQFRQVAIPRRSWVASAGYNDQHEYCVFRTCEKIFIFDLRTDKRLEISAPYNRKEFRETKVLTASNSLIDGGDLSFRIYNIQTAVLLFEYHGKPKKRDVQNDKELFLIVNDFIVVERAKKQIFFYDEEDQTWKSSRTASPRVQQQLYRHVFVSSLLAKTIWHLRTNPILYGFRDFPTLRKVINERLEGIAEWPVIPMNT